MRLISHRGNIEKKINKKENDPDYLLNALDNGFDVEIDLRVNNLDSTVIECFVPVLAILQSKSYHQLLIS